MQHPAWAPLTAFAAALVVVWWLARSRLALDEPNARSLHQRPVPRTGGIGIHLGAVLGWLVAVPDVPWVVWPPYAAVLAISLFDDLHGVPVVVRLVVHLLAGGLMAAVLIFEPAGVAWLLLIAVAVAWMANLYNFMDGSDGLAGGMAVFGFATYGAASWFGGGASFALANFSVAAAATAFLAFNFHPARIFMGDVGSVPLGFLAGAFGIAGWLQHDWPWWFPALVFSPFIVDATVTLARRLLRGERTWTAHRDHYYQRLVQLGWGHRGTALAEYALMLGCGTLALLGLHLTTIGQAIVLTCVAGIYLVLIVAIERAWARRGR